MDRRGQRRKGSEKGSKTELEPDWDFLETEMAWLEENLEALSRLYPPGEWLAIVGRQMVAHAPTLVEVLERSRQAGHPEPFVARVPRHPGIARADCISDARAAKEHRPLAYP